MSPPPALFLDGSREAELALDRAWRAAADALAHAARAEGPASGASYESLAAAVGELRLDASAGVGLVEAVRELGPVVLDHSVRLADPACAAHLHCAPLLASVVAEALIGATNQSMDSFDQAPAATAVERHVMDWLLTAARMPEGDGVMTSGATLSNLMGLLLARERAAVASPGEDPGLPADAGRWRILCSRRAHFSVAQAAFVLGLGREAVVALPTDAQDRLTCDTVEQGLRDLDAAGLRPIALVLTAGTTESGAIDDLRNSTRVARARGIWVHVDAAAGGALLFSPRHRGMVAGIGEADSVALDFHKLLAQSISCGAFLVRRAAELGAIASYEDYLNPEEDVADGVPNLVVKSLQTTRRFDALKVLLSVRAIGVEAWAALVDDALASAAAAARLIAAHEELRLLLKPQTNTVLLRWEPPGAADEAMVDAANAQVHRALWRDGTAVVGRATRDGRPVVKLTFLAPAPAAGDLAQLLERIASAARSHALTAAEVGS